MKEKKSIFPLFEVHTITLELENECTSLSVSDHVYKRVTLNFDYWIQTDRHSQICEAIKISQFCRNRILNFLNT